MSSIVVSGDTSGAVTIAAPAVAGTNTLTLPAVTGTVVVSGQNSAITSGTAVASTSGTSIDFTAIPSWVKRITVMFSGVSLSSSSPYGVIQIGSGSVTSSGYLNTLTTVVPASQVSCVASTTGFYCINLANASDPMNGTMVLTLVGSNLWVASGNFNATNTLRGWTSTGNITLGGSLDRVRITTTDGTTTFDAGSINILYE